MNVVFRVNCGPASAERRCYPAWLQPKNFPKHLVPEGISGRNSAASLDLLANNQLFTHLFCRRSHPWLRYQAAENLELEVFKRPAKRQC